MDYDVIIVGGGPAGAACAATLAARGGSVLVLERAVFPREKVCGDCLNPACWPTLGRLGVEEAVRALPHAALHTVEFAGLRGKTIQLALPNDVRGEIAVKRRLLDALLLENAAVRGADVRQGRAVSQVRREGAGWMVQTARGGGTTTAKEGRYTTRFLVAADGRNSLTARLAGLLEDRSDPATDRVGLQTHVPLPAGFGDKVQMRWFTRGYGGLCPVGGAELNVSLAGPPTTLSELKTWARAEFGLAASHPWRTIAPLDRRPAKQVAAVMRLPGTNGTGGVFLVGDAARVVEPFTGEGIYYALRSGELAGEALVEVLRDGEPVETAAEKYRREHAAMYRGRLWVNRLARAAGRHPKAASWALEVLRWRPEWLGLLTAKVVRS